MIGVVSTAVVLGLIAGFAGGLLSRITWRSDIPDNGSRMVRTTNLALIDDQGRERGIFVWSTTDHYF